MKRHMEFRYLRTIKAIHEHGGEAKAAELSNIMQSALSHQIKGLEEQSGVELSSDEQSRWSCQRLDRVSCVRQKRLRLKLMP